MRYHLLCGLLMAAIFCCGCGGKQKFPAAEETPARIGALVVDRIIEGPVLGQPLRAPAAVASDIRGALFVTDAGNNRLIRFSSDLSPELDVGGFGAAAGLFNRPGFIAIDNSLSLLVADKGNRRLVRFSRDLTFVEEISLEDSEEPGKFGEPSGLVLSSYGEIWMADADNDRIAIFDNIGQFDRFIAEFGYSGGQVNDPSKITVERTGDYLVCDAGNGRLSRYDRFGNHQEDLGEGQLTEPVAAVSDQRGRIWVLDGSRVVCLSHSGRPLYQTETIPGLSPPLRDPADICALSEDRIAIADRGNNRIVVCRAIALDE